MLTSEKREEFPDYQINELKGVSEMESIDELAISQYMTLADKIDKLQRRAKNIQWSFYQQSFHSKIVYTGYEIRSESIKADKAIERLDETLWTIRQHIKLVEIKRRYWTVFLNGLSIADQQYFTRKYIYGHQTINDQLDRLALEEIDEINKAIVYQYCTMTENEELRIELTEGDHQVNINSILEFLEG